MKRRASNNSNNLYKKDARSIKGLCVSIHLEKGPPEKI